MNSTLRIALFGLGMATLGAVSTTTLTAHAVPGSHEGRSGAERGHRGAGMLPGMRFARAIAQLDLTDDQEAMVEDIKEDMHAEMKAMHEGNREDMKGMAELLLSEGDVDSKAVHAMLDDHAAEKLALAHTFVDRVLELRATLTPDQLAELRELRDEHEARGDKDDGPNPKPSPRTRGRR
jgi:Spy/CpxP family protein refolding chaperone